MRLSMSTQAGKGSGTASASSIRYLRAEIIGIAARLPIRSGFLAVSGELTGPGGWVAGCHP
jgi:hypothetical protein